MPGPLGDLGRRDPGIQPSRNGCVAQVLRVLGQRRGVLGIQNSGHGENIQLIGEARKHRHLAKPRCIAAGQRLAGSQVEL